MSQTNGSLLADGFSKTNASVLLNFIIEAIQETAVKLF